MNRRSEPIEIIQIVGEKLSPVFENLADFGGIIAVLKTIIFVLLLQWVESSFGKETERGFVRRRRGRRRVREESCLKREQEKGRREMGHGGDFSSESDDFGVESG